ncbi:MAG: hypothetical protein AAF321_02970 [Pseudomonadota bacterium]
MSIRHAKTAARFASIGVAASLLAACQTVSLPGAGGPFDGRWASTDGVFVASFADGAFTSRATARPDVVLAQGSLTVTGPGSVQLNWFSQSQNANLSANCVSAGRGVLDCTPSRGTAFRLQRQAAG